MINIELTSDAQRAVDDICDKAGMKKRELVARVLRWFAGQGDEVRALVLGQIPKTMVPIVAQTMLQELAKGEAKVRQAGEACRTCRGPQIARPT